MARIRSIKPQFFRHRRLFLAEQETGLPLRVAFAGLWTCADRDGRFRWEPDELKLDCLPYDEVEFSRVMHALFTRGFIVQYASQGKQYGVIPGFKDHQVINNREADSILPEPPNNLDELIEGAKEVDASTTRDPHVTDQTKGKGREKEGKGKGMDSGTRNASVENSFQQFLRSFPKRKGSNPVEPARVKFHALVKTGTDPDLLVAEALRLGREMADTGQANTPYVPQMITWLNQKRFADAAAQAAVEMLAMDTASKKIHVKSETPQWDAWTKFRGKAPPLDKNGGWYFDSEWPPETQALAP